MPVADYSVADSLGGAKALRKFRAELRRHDLKLVLDFIPNHVGVDHPWLTERPELFVRSPTRRPESFPVVHGGGTSWIAHGKDPYFPAWLDTAQLDYRFAATRAAMTETLRSIAEQCDGVRCDMAMLVLNDIFDKTWKDFPNGGSAPRGEFWAGAISAVKRRQPGFLFIAEAYWDVEPRLQELGFDYVYDKKFYDYLAARDYVALQRHVQEVAGRFNPARFLENHDEPRIASLLTMPEQKAAAVLLLAQPGLRLLYDGQLAGRPPTNAGAIRRLLAGAWQPRDDRLLRHVCCRCFPNPLSGAGKWSFVPRASRTVSRSNGRTSPAGLVWWRSILRRSALASKFANWGIETEQPALIPTVNRRGARSAGCCTLTLLRAVSNCLNCA